MRNIYNGPNSSQYNYSITSKEVQSPMTTKRNMPFSRQTLEFDHHKENDLGDRILFILGLSVSMIALIIMVSIMI